MSGIEIPAWLHRLAPGAAQAARTINKSNLSDIQRDRLVRLTSDATRRAWVEPRRRRRKTQRILTEDELWDAHHELMWESFRSADFDPIGRPQIEQSKARLGAISADAGKLAREIREVGNDLQLVGLWLTYRNNRRTDDLLRSLPDDLPLLPDVIDRLADFFEGAAPLYKPEGPVPPVGQPQGPEALKTTVIRRIANTCRKHFDTVLYSTVATLANASLGRTDISKETVRGSLRDIPPRTVA